MPTCRHPQLVNEQTTRPNPSIDTYGVFLRHSHRPAYHAALRTYSIIDGISVDDPPSCSPVVYRSRPRRLADCRQNAWFARHVETGEVRVAASCCNLRWCPVCSNARRNYMTHSISEWIGEADHPKFMTLTLQHSTAPLDFQIDTLYRSFQNLRRRTAFKKAVTGGIWFFQIKKSKTDGLWHPHMHALVTGKYLSKYELSKMWLAITLTSPIVDIRTVRDPQGAASDIARYATSPGSLVGLPPDDAVDLVNALDGRRICGKWGTAREVCLRPKRVEEPGKWESIGSWTTVFQMYETDPGARAIVSSWKNKQPLPSGISCTDIDALINNLSDAAWADYDFESVYDQKGPET